MPEVLVAAALVAWMLPAAGRAGGCDSGAAVGVDFSGPARLAPAPAGAPGSRW